MSRTKSKGVQPAPLSHCDTPLVEHVGTRNDGTERYRCQVCRQVVSIPPAPATEGEREE